MNRVCTLLNKKHFLYVLEPWLELILNKFNYRYRKTNWNGFTVFGSNASIHAASSFFSWSVLFHNVFLAVANLAQLLFHYYTAFLVCFFVQTLFWKPLNTFYQLFNKQQWQQLVWWPEEFDIMLAKIIARLVKVVSTFFTSFNVYHFWQDRIKKRTVITHPFISTSFNNLSDKSEFPDSPLIPFFFPSASFRPSFCSS